MPSASICCWPPDRLPAGSSSRCAEDREELEGPGSTRPRSPPGRPAAQPAGQPQVLAHGQRREHALAAGHLDDAAGGDLVRRGVGDVAPVEDDRAAVGLDQPGDGLEQRRLAGAVGAEQGDDLALADLEVDAEQHLHVAVGDVELADEQQLGPALPALVQRLGPGGGRRPHLVMSSPIRLPAEAMTRPADEEDRGHDQHARRGCRSVSPTADERSTTRPGRTHSEATEKPDDRARGGMASDSAARMPGQQDGERRR